MEMTDVSSSRISSSRPGPTQLGSIQVRTLYRHLIKNSSPHPRFMPMHWRNAPQTSIASKQVYVIVNVKKLIAALRVYFLYYISIFVIKHLLKRDPYICKYHILSY